MNYTCKEGYYFGADYHQQAFTLTCFTNGTVGGDDWAHCYHPSERFCFDPPVVPYNGGQGCDSIAFKAIFLAEFQGIINKFVHFKLPFGQFSMFIYRSAQNYGMEGCNGQNGCHTQSDWNEAQYSGSRTPYATVVTYTCGLGRQLFEYLPDETVMYDTANYTCQWDRTWFPETPVDDCEWVACIDPPLPEGHNLRNRHPCSKPHQ